MILFFIPQFFFICSYILYTTIILVSVVDLLFILFLQGPLITSQSYIMIHIMQHNVHSSTQVPTTQVYCSPLLLRLLYYYYYYYHISHFIHSATVHNTYIIYTVCLYIESFGVYLCIGRHIFYIYTYIYIWTIAQPHKSQSD